jgi:hypothetical protein
MKSDPIAASEHRSPLSVRARFTVFKRDDFTCQYCGRKTPEVVLEVDHIVPSCDGGSNDVVNLTTSCWECNRGKGSTPLEELRMAEDPHDRTILLLERERQLREYNVVLERIREEREAQAWELWRYWENDEAVESIPRRELSYLILTLEWCPAEKVRDYMDVAIRHGYTRDLRYVKGCLKNYRQQEGQDGAHPHDQA